mgnify:CR=1 FL=1
MRKFTPYALLLIAALITGGCRATSYEARRVPLNADEPSWIARGNGEFLTDDGKKFIAVGRAWETPDYDARRQEALQKARAELRNQLRAYIEGLSHQLAARSEKQFGASPDESREFFLEIGDRIIEERVRSLQAADEWESMIRHEVYVRVELPTALVLDDFRKGVLAGMAAGGDGLFTGFIQKALKNLERELDKAVARSPMGDLAA